jgi:hypothetical protein
VATNRRLDELSGALATLRVMLQENPEDQELQAQYQATSKAYSEAIKGGVSGKKETPIPQTVAIGQELVQNGKKYRITGVDADGTAIGEEIP